jgi:hypothetical protein
MKPRTARPVKKRAAKPASRTGKQPPAVMHKPIAADAAPPGVLLSESQIGEEFCMDRRTVKKRLADSGVKPVAKRNGYDVFRLKEVAAMLMNTEEGKADPDKMTPFERQAHYKAESEKLRVEQERGMLLQREDSETEMARVLKVVAQELDVMVDEIERDCGATPEQLAKIEAKADLIRKRMYDGIVEGATASEESLQTELIDGD